MANNMHVVYIKLNNLSIGTRTFKPGTKGAELVPDMKIVSDNIFIKVKGNALTSEEFAAFIDENKFEEMLVYYASKGCSIKKLEEVVQR